MLKLPKTFYFHLTFCAVVAISLAPSIGCSHEKGKKQLLELHELAISSGFQEVTWEKSGGRVVLEMLNSEVVQDVLAKVNWRDFTPSFENLGRDDLGVKDIPYVVSALRQIGSWEDLGSPLWGLREVTGPAELEGLRRIVWNTFPADSLVWNGWFRLRVDQLKYGRAYDSFMGAASLQLLLTDNTTWGEETLAQLDSIPTNWLPQLLIRDLGDWSEEKWLVDLDFLAETKQREYLDFWHEFLSSNSRGQMSSREFLKVLTEQSSGAPQEVTVGPIISSHSTLRFVTGLVDLLPES